MKRKTVLRFLVAFACSLFIVSIFEPFLQALLYGLPHAPEVHAVPENFWSFKGAYVHGASVVEEWWFANYWSRARPRMFDETLGPWIGPVLIFMLEAQVFTVLFAALAIFNVKSYLILSSTVLNVFTTLCMWFVGNALPSWYLKNFEAGFWLSFPSTALFLAALLLSWKRKKESTTFSQG